MVRDLRDYTNDTKSKNAIDLNTSKHGVSRPYLIKYVARILSGIEVALMHVVIHWLTSRRHEL